MNVVMVNYNRSRGEVVARVNIDLIDPARVYDLANPAVREQFIRHYPRWGQIYDVMAGEGAVLIRGDIPVEAVTGLVHVPKSYDQATVRRLIGDLVR
jgi:hypothetical protein